MIRILPECDRNRIISTIELDGETIVLPQPVEVPAGVAPVYKDGRLLLGAEFSARVSCGALAKGG